MNSPAPFAGPLCIPRLYHYQDFQPNHEHADRLADILMNHRVYCSNPANFNDPWDGKPYFDPHLLDDPTNRALTTEFLIANQRADRQSDSDDHLLRTDLALLKHGMQLFSRHLVDFVSERWGVYCLSPISTSTLMWSHYARDHKGICLEFGVSGSKFMVARQVQYSAEYPALVLGDPDLHRKLLAIKSDDWQYEQEFRMLGVRWADMPNPPLLMEGNYLPINPNDLTAIILGCQADPATISAIIALIKEHAPRVAVKQAKRALNKYQLIIEDLGAAATA